jgi:hypothetical protein
MLKRACIVLVCFVISLFCTVLPLIADEMKPHRGDFPKCQETCLTMHKAKMYQLITDYAQRHEKISFQDGVDKALSEYKNCIDNCREPMSVK